MSKEEVLDRYRQSRERLLAAIEGLSDQQMTERSLDGWSVNDHLAHLAVWDDLRADEVARISAGNDSVWRMTEQQDKDFNEMTYDLRRSLSVNQIKWELANSRRRLLSAIETATPEGLDASRYGEAGLLSGHEAMHAEWIERWRSEKGF